MRLGQTHRISKERSERLTAGASVLLAMIGMATVVFHTLGDGRWSWLDCIYMTIITLSTVGFAETLPGMDQVAAARWFTIALIVFGSGMLIYVASTIAAVIIDGDLRGVFRWRKMEKTLSEMSGHFVVCGAGSTGSRVVEELVLTHESFVVIDQDAVRVERLEEDLNTELMHIQGDATEDAVLQHAGIERAAGVVCTLSDDKENLFVTLSARGLNPNARIVARAIAPEAASKMRRAGADAVVSPNAIGGMRLANELLRPTAVAFIDHLMRDREAKLRVDAVSVGAEAELAGRPLGELDLQANGVLVLAYQDEAGRFQPNPPASYQVTPRHKLIVLAEAPDMDKLKARLV